MSGRRRTRALCVLLLTLLSSVVKAADVFGQDTQAWPEVGVYVKLDGQSRLYFIASGVEEGGDPTGSEFGPNLDIYLKPIRQVKHWAGFRLDESKNRLLHVRLGYRYLPSFAGDPDENRGVFEATARYPLVRGMLVSNRNRVDLRLLGGAFSWRYRNRLSMEKEFSVGWLSLNPYLRAEVFYDSRYAEWSRTELTGGAAFPVNRRWEVEAYFAHQNNTGKSPNQQVEAVGVALNLYVR